VPSVKVVRLCEQAPGCMFMSGKRLVGETSVGETCTIVLLGDEYMQLIANQYCPEAAA